MWKRVCRFATQTSRDITKLNKISPETMRLRCGSPKLTKAIIRETEISNDHFTPEISLHLITPNCRLYKSVSSEYMQVFEEKIYWAYYHACMQGLARYLLDNPKKVEGKSVLDFRGGCGACSIAAMKGNAHYVLNNEESEGCCCAAMLNGILNDMPIERFITYNQCLIGYPIKEQVILFNDVNRYQEQNERICSWLDRLHDEGKLILIAEAHTSDRWISPEGRFGQEFMHKQAVYTLPNDIRDATDYDSVTIWKY